MSGILELIIFHPIDTIAKRLMANQGKVGLSNVMSVIFKDSAKAGVFRKWASLFPGVEFGAGYKVLQRTYKFGGQPYVKDFINHNFGTSLTNSFGVQKGKIIASAIAGSIMGVGEVVLLPLDVLKIKAQTNPEVLRGKGLMEILSHPRALYSGAGWTAARNAPGSFALFGGNAFVLHTLFHLKDVTEATVAQNLWASVGGAVASITVAAPLDVIKTRIQRASFESRESGFTILTKMARQEGLSSFFKGLVPKLFVVGPKLIFSMTVATSITNFIVNRNM
uniref:Mitochondrial carrier protein n=1 Tax=Arcella intermedia TaxID=1963864 RepID=A0A6B2LBX0_9EUKA